MNEADRIWMWFCLGTFLVAVASINFGLAIWNMFLDKPSNVLISSGFGGLFTGLFTAMAIKLWLGQKFPEERELERKHE